MRKIPGQQRRISKLDELVYRFQHRWETNPQYRAAVSGVVGLVVILAICSCLGVLSAVTNSVLASAGAGGSGAPTGSLNTGTGQVAPATAFPTYTLPPFKQNPIPAASPIPNSQTPPPGVTPTITPTPAPAATSPGSGGPGGKVPTTCNGNGWVINPCPLIHGQSGTLTVSMPSAPNSAVNLLLSFGACASDDCTIDDPPSFGLTTDGSGTVTLSFTVPADVQTGSQIPVSGMANAGNATVTYSAAPVK